MRIVVYGGRRRLGALVEDGVVDLTDCVDRFLGRRPSVSAAVAECMPRSGLLDFIRQGQAALDLAGEALEREMQGGIEVLAGQAILPPWPGRRVICGGGNHPVHMSRALTTMGHPVSADDYRDVLRAEGPRGFFKAISVACGSDDFVRLPGEDVLLDYEGELALVIGRAAKKTSPGDYRKLVWGLTLICDWSVREMCWPPANDPFNSSKNFDDAVSIGPCIAVGEELDPDNLVIETRVNGALRQAYSTAEFALTFGETLAGLTRTLSVVPGDLLSAGSGPGTVMDTVVQKSDGTWPRDQFLTSGDRVEVSCREIGTLSTTIAPPSDEPEDPDTSHHDQ